MWIEPSARHHTSSDVLAQEEHIICWAMDAQLDPPAPSTTVNTGRLDVMQAEAAAAVAGSDRLVLVVGPAGAGKTTMLAAAVDDLTTQGRVVFGVAPTAKAARVLESETRHGVGHGGEAVARVATNRSATRATVAAAGGGDGDRRRGRHDQHRRPPPTHPPGRRPAVAVGVGR